MTQEERYQKKLHLKQLDEKYLQKQLIKLNENKSEILIRINNFKRKHKYKISKDIYLLQPQVIKLLNANNRAIDLLVQERYIKNAFGGINSIYTLSDITMFMKNVNFGV